MVKKFDNINEVPKHEMQAWVAALRSGDFKQGASMLQTPYGHCCLGVACELFIPKNLQQRDESGFLEGGYPSTQKNSPEWLKIINVDFGERTGAGLSSLNDNGDLMLERFTFDEIADLLQAVYLLEVLE